jgi:hypothetical protein
MRILEKAIESANKRAWVDVEPTPQASKVTA